MAEQKVSIRNLMGLHARAAAKFVRLSSTFESEILVRFRDMEVDGKSIMGVMMLAATPGSELLISACGTDEDAAVAELADLVRTGFGELS
ncbi:MAG: HPr family phosphocarrier protein [Nitrospinae bacterium]|nr:HPr family phosphocarrier protein [Nitrospinota bacterium]